MKLWLKAFAVGVALVAAGWAHAQTNCPPAAPVFKPEMLPELQKNAQNRGFLWRITKGGNTSYLYGTLHVGKLEWTMPGPSVIGALRDINTVAMELNLSDPATLQALTTPTPAVRELEARASEALPLLARLEAQSCAPEGVRALPMAFRVGALMANSAKFEGMFPEYGTEIFLVGLAQSGKLPITGLEEARLQLETLTRVFLGGSGKGLGQTLEAASSPKAREQSKLLGQMWANSDLARLADYAAWCECTDTPEDRAAMKLLLDDRNGPMADKIAGLHESGKRVFAAVGSLHFVGPTSIAQLMKQKGYEVEQLVPAPK